MRRSIVSYAIALCFLGMLTAKHAAATTWLVPANVPTIKQAVEDSAAYGDTVLVEAGTYDTGSGEVFPINMTNGVVLMSVSGPTLSMIDADSTGTVISCSNCDQSTQIIGFTITGGYAQDGGGIHCSQSSVTIRDNVITNNTAISSTGGGGGIGCFSSEPTISHNTIIRNASLNRFGGGIYNYYCSSSAIIEHNTVAENTSMWGGGIFNDHSSPMIYYNIIRENHSIMSGGGLDCYTGSSPDIMANVIVGNSSGTDGAGIACCYSCAPYVAYNTIARNVGDFGGGVRSLGNSSPVVTSNIIVDNVDGLYLISTSNTMTANYNSIYYNSHQPDDYEVINNTSFTIDITNNFWWTTDQPSIASSINGPANFTPFSTLPHAGTPNQPHSVSSVMAMNDSTYTTPLNTNLQIGDTIYVQLIGADWYGGFFEPALVMMRTLKDQYGIAVALIETDTASGIYQGWACVADTSNDILNHIAAHPQDILIIEAHVDTTKRDTVLISTIGVHEDKPLRGRAEVCPTTIIRGSLHLPEGTSCRIYDIAGRTVQRDMLTRGIYFLEIDGTIAGKVIKIE
ncbi:MAG: right-handed parallel beta-helix repeat-containing protein [candidate division WOR-3 bacterium]|nr:MAG: right-handed parallel beta-helix repeat-containing protein [candidate division WOR-3 bacterium]